MLAAGLPLGRLAWGGVHRVPPGRLRLASFASAVIAVAGAMIVTQAAGLGPALVPAAALRPILWMLAALFAISIVANALGAKGAERLHGVPLATLLVLSCANLALAAPG